MLKKSKKHKHHHSHNHTKHGQIVVHDEAKTETKNEAEFQEFLTPSSTSFSRDKFSINSVGEFLRDRRRNLKIEINDVSSFLKVKPHDIEAIEDDDLASITKHLYVPGLIRSYARFLKIDPQTIEENIRLLPIKSNTENKKHQLLNIGENTDLTPNKDSFFNFLLVSILLFLVLLSFYNSIEDKSGLITNKNLISELGKIE
jgi:hypothetical protein